MATSCIAIKPHTRAKHQEYELDTAYAGFRSSSIKSQNSGQELTRIIHGIDGISLDL